MIDKIKVTFIAGYYEPDVSADTYLNSSLCNGLAKLNYSVNVVAPFPCRGISKKIIKQYKNKKKEINEYGVVINRVGFSSFKKNILLRAIDFIIKICILLYVGRKINTDVYILMSTPPFLGIISKFLTKGSIKVYRLQDIFPDNLISSDIIGSKSIIFKFLKILENSIYQSNDLIITVSEDMKKQLLQRKVSLNKIDVIYNWIDPNKCKSISKIDNILYKKFNIDSEKFTVLYAGNIGVLQNLRTIVYAANELKNIEGIQFVIVGDGVKKNDILELIEKLSLNNIKVYPLQSANKISCVYSLGDVGLVSLKPGVSKLALPSKTWSIMSASRPVICEIDSYSEMNIILEKNQCGYCVSPGDYHLMAKYIMDFYENEKWVKKMGNNSRNYILKHLTERENIEKFSMRLKKMIKERDKCLEIKRY